MKQRWAMFAMGAWLSGMVIVSVVAAQNFYVIDRLLSGSTNPAFSASVGQLGHQPARDLLRYLSSELNRFYFQLWNATQIAIGLLMFWLVWGSRVRPMVRWGVLVMLAIVVVMMLGLTPEITAVGRRLDFVPRDPPPPDMGRFWILHAAYTGLAMFNLIVGVVVALWIGRDPIPRQADQQVG
jgi:hypothetical protein